MDMGCIYWDMLFLQRHQYYPMVTSLYKILHSRGFPYGKVVKKKTFMAWDWCAYTYPDKQVRESTRKKKVR
jgi:hypothetical protein